MLDTTQDAQSQHEWFVCDHNAKCLEQVCTGTYHHGSLSLLGGFLQLRLQGNELLLHVCHTALCCGQLLQPHLIPLLHCCHLEKKQLQVAALVTEESKPPRFARNAFLDTSSSSCSSSGSSRVLIRKTFLFCQHCIQHCHKAGAFTCQVSNCMALELHRSVQRRNLMQNVSA